MASGRPLPAGLVTFVFTDIEGSTRLFRRVGDRYPDLLIRHNEILRAAWAAFGGCEVKTEGDAFFVVFDDAAAAVQACAHAERGLALEPWPDDAIIRVRMGLHTGLASPRGDDYIAMAVHQAARVVNAGHGGQVLASAETVARITEAVALVLVSLGRYRVRDFDEPIELFQITGPGLPTEFPSLRVPPADQHNLVAAPTSVVGRDDDLAVFADLVRSARLVSVVGPGGIGKTRVVTEFGLRHAREWDDGVWFVDLTPVNDTALLARAVAEAIGVPTVEAMDVRTAVLDHLRGRRAVVMMDNCEHLTVGVARHVDELLRGCPMVRVVATSREPLGLRGERIWRLPPLAAHDAGIQLFCDRAGLTCDADPSLRGTLIELCGLLDGLPLAIELAASRCEVLTPAEILGRLGRHKDLLRSNDPTLSDRQRSLDDTIVWSHQLLSSNEQLAFRRLGVFAAGFGLEAATAVVADDLIDAYDVPELVWSLVSKSLVTSEPAAGSTRYRLLATIRDFARRELDRAEELPGVAVALGRFFVEVYGPQLDKADVQVLTERGREIDNVRPLIAIVAPHDAELAQALACTVVVDHRNASPAAGLDEGLRLLDLLTAPTPERVALFAGVAGLAIDCGDIETASNLNRRAEVLAAETGSPHWIDGQIDQQRGIIAIHHGDVDEAGTIAMAGLVQTATQMGRVRLLNLLCLAASERGAYDEARRAAEDLLDIVTELGMIEARIIDLANLAEIELRAGHPHSAARFQLIGLDLALEAGSLLNVSSALIIAARLASLTGDWTTATRLQSAADATMSRIGQSLYPTDRELCDTLLASAVERLGEKQFERATDVGRSLAITDAVQEARSVLTAVGHGGPPRDATPSCP